MRAVEDGDGAEYAAAALAAAVDVDVVEFEFDVGRGGERVEAGDAGVGGDVERWEADAVFGGAQEGGELAAFDGEWSASTTLHILPRDEVA